MSCSCTGAVISARSGRRSTFAVWPSWSAWSHAGTTEVSSVASRITGSTGALGFIVITSSSRNWYDGMFTRRPLIAQWPWRIICRAWRREADEHVVEARLEQPQQVLAGHAGLPAGLVVVVAELLLEHAVIPPRLLLLAQLQPVLRLPRPAAAVVARRVVAPLDAALVRQAALALQEELHALAAALLALGACLSGHGSDPPALARPAPVVGLRGHVPDRGDLEAGRLERADRGLTARARALHEHLDLLKPMLHALARRGVGGDLRRERRGLARAPEAGAARRLPRDHVAVLVG